MIENKCDNCKLQTLCKNKDDYTVDRKRLLGYKPRPPLRSETTVITVMCTQFTPTQAAQMAEAAAAMQKIQQALAPLAELGKAAGNGKTDKDGGGQQ